MPNLLASEDLHFPESLRYDLAHLWVKSVGDDAIIGVTDYAQRSWGDVGFVQLPKVGDVVRAGEAIGQISCAAAGPCDLISPVSGEVTAVNDRLTEEPGAINADPYGDGWLFRVDAVEPAQFRDLLDAGVYRKSLEEPLPVNVEAALNTVFFNSMDGMVLVDHHRRVLAMNAAAEELTGYSARNVVGTSQCYHLFRCEAGGERLHGIDCPGVATQTSARRGCTTHFAVTRRDGSQVPVTASYSALPIDGSDALFLLITLRERNEVPH